MLQCNRWYSPYVWHTGGIFKKNNCLLNVGTGVYRQSVSISSLDEFNLAIFDGRGKTDLSIFEIILFYFFINTKFFETRYGTFYFEKIKHKKAYTDVSLWTSQVTLKSNAQLTAFLLCFWPFSTYMGWYGTLHWYV